MNNASKARIRQALEIVESVVQSHIDAVDALADVSGLSDKQLDELLRAKGIDIAYLERVASGTEPQTKSPEKRSPDPLDSASRHLRTKEYTKHGHPHMTSARAVTDKVNEAIAGPTSPSAANRKRPPARVLRRPSAGERVIAPVSKRVLVRAAAASFEPFQSVHTSQGRVHFFEVGRSVYVRFVPQSKPTVLILASVEYHVTEPASEPTKKDGLLKVGGLDRLQVNHFLELYERQPRKFKIRWR